MLTLLALAGVALYIRDVADLRQSKDPQRTFILLGAALWILMFFGRPFWGRLLILLAVPPDMQLHRVIGGAQIFLVLIAATALSAIWQGLLRKTHVAVAAMVTMVLLFPMVRERERYLADNRTRGYANLATYEANRPAIDATIAISRHRGGRAFAGIPGGWGGEFKIGAPPFFYYLSEAGIPAVSYLFHSMSLSSEIMTRFDETSPAQYRLFDVRTVIAPSDSSVALPQFLAPLSAAGPLAIYAAPAAGHFDVVDVPVAVKTSKNNFYDINDRWMSSDWVDRRQHLLLDFRGDAPAAMEVVPPDAARFRNRPRCRPRATCSMSIGTENSTARRFRPRATVMFFSKRPGIPIGERWWTASLCGR